MNEIYRVFPLYAPSVWGSVVAFIKANWKACNDANKPLRIEVTNRKPKTSPQNRFFHGPCLRAIAEQAWWNGQQFPVEFWREYFKRRYLLKASFMTPAGEELLEYWSIADLSDHQMAEFVTNVQAEAAAEWGVIFE